MHLDEVVANDVIPWPTDSEAIIMKILSSFDRLESRRDKAINDFDAAMKLLGKMYHDGRLMSYKSDEERMKAANAFNSFYPTYKAGKDEKGEFYWTEEQWKIWLKID